MLDEAQARLAAVARGDGAAGRHRTPTDVIARVRQYLADDLDTPKALAALDGWTTDALEYGGHDADGAAAVATAVDALLGVQL